METVSIFTIILRGFLYGLVTGFVILSGSILSKGFTNNLFLLGIPIVFSIDFFIKYSICFNYSKKSNENTKQQYRLSETEAVWIIRIIATLISIVLCILFKVQTSEWPKKEIIIPIAIFVCLYLAYGNFLLKRYRESIELSIRHQLFWPTMLTVGFSLYFSLYFDSFFDNQISITKATFYPVYIVFGYFLVSEYLIKEDKCRSLVNYWCGYLFFGSILISNYFIDRNSEYFGITSNVTFCLTVCAYFAAFEAWRITPYARRTGFSYQNSIKVRDVSDTVPLWQKYYIGALGVIMVCICLIPFLSIYSNYKSNFLIWFCIHSVLAFVMWYYWGRKDKKQGFWDSMKLFFGISFILILDFDALLGYQYEGLIITSFVDTSIEIIKYFGGTFLIWLLLQIAFVRSKDSNNLRWDFFSKTNNYFLIASIICVGFCYIIHLIQKNKAITHEILVKSTHVYYFYFIIFLVTSALSILDFIERTAQTIRANNNRNN